MAGPRHISLEVEDNDNCPGIPERTFEVQGQPRMISQVLIAGPRGPEQLHQVTGWQSEDNGSPCPAYYVPVTDSGLGVAYLVFGGDWGIRFRPLGSTEEWSADSPDQWGEPYLILSDAGDIVAKDEES
ncbi:MAG: hypothetical protein HYX93_05645 [Chloroflexi bacterium]|nr:hypothetical protein [Chloroflexota bacterium]